VTSDDAARLSVTGRWLRSLGSLQGEAPAFDTADAPDDPAALFLHWLRGAVDAGVPEAHAGTLATVAADGIPDARTLVLKDVGAQGWAVAGSRASRKGVQLAATPTAALSFWWQPVVRAVRVRGTVHEGTRAEIEADLAARPARTVSSADDWMLWWIDPVRVEFWQGSPSRHHTRLVYEKSGRAWTHRLLSPTPAPTDERGTV